MKTFVALLLTLAAGEVDIIGYISVYHFFVAHMTGTTVHLGNKLTIGAWKDAAPAAVIIFSFVLASVVGRSIIEAEARTKRRTVATITLLAEAALILIFIMIRPKFPTSNDPRAMPLSIICLLLAILAAAMGLQTATLTRIGPLTIHTTFVTGMLNKLAQALSKWLFWIHDQRRSRATISEIIHGSRQNAAFHNAQLMVSIWCSYLIGSIAGTWTNSHWPVRALYVPVTILVLCAVIDQVQPLSIEEEKEQA